MQHDIIICFYLFFLPVLIWWLHTQLWWTLVLLLKHKLTRDLQHNSSTTNVHDGQEERMQLLSLSLSPTLPISLSLSPSLSFTYSTAVCDSVPARGALSERCVTLSLSHTHSHYHSHSHPLQFPHIFLSPMSADAKEHVAAVEQILFDMNYVYISPSLLSRTLRAVFCFR